MLSPAPILAPSNRRAAAAQPRLSVVIVNYCRWQGTARLARQVLRSEAGRRGLAEVVVVDNHSPPHRLIRRLRRWPGVSLRRWKGNHGFARAANEGCRLSRGDWFLLLNPDITLTDGFIDHACQLAQTLAATEPGRGLVGFQLRNPDGSRQLSVGRFPTLASSLIGLLAPRARRKYRRVLARQRCSVLWATGCCLLIRRDCFRQLGGFDPAFFLYYEDVDLCRRARQAGWKVAFEPALAAIHHQPLHRRPVSPRMRLITRHALLTYAAKHWPAWQAWLLGRLVQAEGWLRAAWADWQGNRRAQQQHQRLSRLAAALARGEHQRVQRSLRRYLRQTE